MKNLKRKEEIINTSLTLFYERGYDNVSVIDICEACHITKPTFYKYIPSKEDLLRYHYRGTADELYELLRKLESQLNYWRLIVIGLTFTLRKSVKMGPALYGQYMTVNFRQHTLTARYNSPARDSTINAIRNAQKLRQIRNMTDPTDLYLTGRNLGLGYALKWCMLMGNYDVVEQVIHALEVLFEPDYETIEEQCKFITSVFEQ